VRASFGFWMLRDRDGGWLVHYTEARQQTKTREREENERSAERTGPASINALRFLAVDESKKRSAAIRSAVGLRPDCVSAVSQADEARPGCAEVDRPRPVVLSNGHASMLLYGSLHLSGYDLPMSQLEQFRQWDRRRRASGARRDAWVEVTTGPLGQGFGMAVEWPRGEASGGGVQPR